MACGCAGRACACAIAGSTNVVVTGVGSTASPYVITVPGGGVGPAGPTGPTGANGTNGMSDMYFPQAAVISVFPRNNATTTSGIAGGGPTPGGRYVGFVAPASITVSRLTAYVTTAGTSMLSNIAALYTVASNGDLTQVAVSAANTTWLGTLGKQSLAFVTPVTLVQGNAYCAVIYDNQSTGTVPQVAAAPALNSAAQYTGILQPFVEAGNASVPAASITFASLTSSAGAAIPYLELS